MFQRYSYSDQITFFQKIRSFDYVLMICVLAVGIISIFAMYSTDGGEIKYHTKHFNHNWKVTLVDTGLNTLKGGRIKKLESYLLLVLLLLEKYLLQNQLQQ